MGVAMEASDATAPPRARPPPKKKWIKEYLEEEPAALVAPRNGVVLPRLTLLHNLHAATATAAVLTPSSGSAPGGGARAGTREVHNKLEKNRRAHLKECFELLKRQLPAADDKKASNLAILGSANRYIQVLRRKERECEHEMERLAREKIAAQQRLATLRRDLILREPAAPAAADAPHPEAAPAAAGHERLNGHVVGIPISIKSAGGASSALTAHTVVAPLTLASHQNGVSEKVLGGALVHPAHLHLPLSQMLRAGGGVGGGVVVGGALQLVGGGGGALRVLHRASCSDGGGGVVVTPLVVSQAQQLLHAHTLAHKVETQVVSTQYVSGLVEPVVVVSAAPAPPHT